MPKCSHCGEEISEVYLCPECGYRYCLLHFEPINHDCSFVSSAQKNQIELQIPQEPRESQNYSKNTCWFCGEKGAEMFECLYCRQWYCERHKEQNNHDCPSIFETTNLPSATQDISIGQKSELRFPQNDEIEVPSPYEITDGKIELDSAVIQSVVDNIIRASIEFEQDEIFKEFVKSNPSGPDLVEKMLQFKTQPIIESLFTWMEGYTMLPSSAVQWLSDKNLTLHQILLDYCKYLYDGSYLDEIEGIDSMTGESINHKIIVGGTISVSKRVLTELSEEARKINVLECIGFLTGERNLDGTISRIDGFIPYNSGTKTVAYVPFEEMVKIIEELEDKGEKVIGWYHSHPKNGAPAYSSGDQKYYLTVKYTLSLYNHLKSAKLSSELTKKRILYLFSHLTFLERAQMDEILETILPSLSKWRIFSSFESIIYNFFVEIYNKYNYWSPENATTNSVPSFLNRTPEVQKEISTSYILLKYQITDFVKRSRFKGKPVEFRKVPLIGMVLCPATRYIALMDCTFEGIVNQWRYYQIKIF